jgi:4-hydroxyphenylpyruvate dioxygenase
MPDQRRGIATVCLSGSLPDKLEAAARAGFDSVEIFEPDLLAFDGTPQDVRRLCEDQGLAISMLQPFRDFEAMPEPQRARNLDRARKKFEVMQALGTGLLLVCSNVQDACADDPARAAADLHDMAALAQAQGLRIGFEALAWGRHTNRWRQAWQIVRGADHPALGLVLDSFHTLAVGDDLAGLSDVPAEKLFFVQLADAPKLAQDALSWSRHFRNFPGQGELPVADFVRAVTAAGYTGPLSLEVFNDAFRAAPARRIATDAIRALAWLDGETGAAPLPAPPKLLGMEFLEFAVDTASGAELAGMLRGLGFRHAGSHRSKAVELYRHGGINFVLNAEPDTTASWHFERHGPSVCAIALAVDDSARALTRADALHVPIWQERVGEGERSLPAVRAPDGTLVFLVEPSASGADPYAADFTLVPGQDAGGLTRIDHIAQALEPGQMEGFVLFWRAMFGLAPQPLVELPDPHGLVRSRALVSADGAVRVTLNESEDRATETGRFVSAFAGAGVHHIALEAADPGAVLHAAQAAGIETLGIPPNYFDDIDARFGLDAALLARLRGQGLLYDREASGGALLHGYTGDFQEKFFLEILRRVDGYHGFGAANAPVRIAAQARKTQRAVR